MSNLGNFVQCRFVTPLAIGATEMTLYAADAPYNLPPAGGGLLVLCDSPGNPSFIEVISYASRTGLNLSGVVRGLEGTTARAWSGFAYCFQSMLAGDFQSLLDSKLNAATYTAADVLTKIKTVDGAGSGLDADLLDGQSGAYYLSASNLNAGTVPDARLSGTYTGVSITGNAATATKLTTARTINGVAFDGTTNINVADATKEPSIAAGAALDFWRGDKTWGRISAADVPSLDASKLGSGTIPELRMPARLGTVAALVTDWDNATQIGWYMGSGAANAPTVDASWYAGDVVAHAPTWVTQTVSQFSGDNPSDTKTWRRDRNSGTWGAWYRLRLSESEQSALYNNASNLSSGIVPDARLSGTYTGVNITGNASSASAVAWSGVSGKPTTLAGYGITNGYAMDGVNTGWFRSSNASGWYNETYGGGIHMSDATYVRTYNGKSFLCNNVMRVEGTTPQVQLWDSDHSILRYLYADGGSIGFLNSTGNWSLTNDNSGNTTSTGNVTAYSDIRLKKDIELIPDALDKVCALRGVTYERIDSGERQTGVIAQEVQAVLPEAVMTMTDEQQTLSVAYGNLVGLLIEAIKELKAEVDVLKQGTK